MRVSAPWLLSLALAMVVPGCAADESPAAPGTGTGTGSCLPESDQELCAQSGGGCDELTLVDRCGVTRTLVCDPCVPPDTCGGSGQPGVCGHGDCVPESDEELCQSLGKDCDPITATDRCGQSRTPNCGTCPPDTTCGGAGVDNVCGDDPTEPEWCVPTTPIPNGWSWLDNGSAHVSVYVPHGAAIGHFAVAGNNVLDSNDTGRYLQQSFYGNQMGGSWHGNPWPFNPVQGGSADGDPSPVTEFCNDGTTLYAKTIPMDWGGTGLTPCVMEEWITLIDDVAMFRFRFEYNGDWTNDARHQEVPAFFVDRELEFLTYYEGNAPWTNGTVTQILPYRQETQGNQYINFDEPWLAYVDSNDWGVGLYKRDEDFATAYRYGDMTDGDATSYFAFLDTFALTPALVHEYTVYAKIGTLTEIRAAFAQLYQAGL